jgi:hypothetical protein
MGRSGVQVSRGMRDGTHSGGQELADLKHQADSLNNLNKKMKEVISQINKLDYTSKILRPSLFAAKICRVSDDTKRSGFIIRAQPRWVGEKPLHNVGFFS